MTALLGRVPLLEALVAFSLFPAVYLGADRMAPIEAAAPVNPYYLAVVAAVTLAVVVFLVDRRIYPLSAAVVLACLAFVGWAWLSLRWTVGTGEYPTYKLHRMIAFNTVLLTLGLVLAQSRHRIVAFALVMGLIGAWLSAEALYASQVLGEFAFATVGSDSYLTHGRAIGFAVPLLAYVLFAHPRPSFRLLAGALIAVGIVGSATAGGRGPFVALIVALAVFVFIEFVVALVTRRVDFVQLGVGVVAAVAVAGTTALVIRSLGGMPWTVERLLDSREQSSGETRLVMIREAYDLWLDEPVRGHGIGSFEVLTTTVHQYPHNVVVETLAELGLVGFALASLVVLTPLIGSLYARLTGGDAIYSALVALFVYALVNASLSFDLQANRQLFFAVGLMALAWTEAERGWLSRSIRFGPASGDR
ncbi:O-antigen ligase family protein [Halovivax gelatinilyticus]|uniref:O-antigen ligase family protein n=1 Tax=Halovivax gelatinilyticus TaxID=2961597 RepID=UPI0020CA89E5|nr:O-antigen ligase family protein [Halovivax gelatinilyticus]